MGEEDLYVCFKLLASVACLFCENPLLPTVVSEPLAQDFSTNIIFFIFKIVHEQVLVNIFGKISL